MLVSIYSIYDTGVSVWGCPMFFRNNGEALRWFTSVVNNPDTPFGKNPSDYCMFHVGSWTDDNCEFKLLDVPCRLGLALEFVKAPAKVPV